MPTIILASRSPRRQELLRRIGLEDFSILVPHAEECCAPGLSPEETVAAISRAKAQAAAALCRAEDILIAADTMVFLDGQRLGKPADEEDAFRMLSALSGREHAVCTGLTVRQGGTVVTEAERTLVRFRPLTEGEIRAYIATGEPMDKAGSYGIQDRGALLVEGITGDFFNVMGLPVLRLARILRRFGLDLLGRG